VVVNLLENALRFTPSGGQVSICAKQEGNNLIIDVTDTGCGIPVKDITKVFEPYYTTTTTAIHDGLGLGLPLAKTIIELHGGHIWANNLPRKGAEVGLSIPLRQVKSQ